MKFNCDRCYKAGVLGNYESIIWGAWFGQRGQCTLSRGNDAKDENLRLTDR